MRGKDIDIRLVQYQQCCEHMRHHNNVIWKIPSFIIVINGAVVVGAFDVIEIESIRVYLLWISTFVSFALFIAIVKHHFYYELEVDTIDLLEDELGTKRIKKKTFDTLDKVYWVSEATPETLPRGFGKLFRFFEKWSSHVALMMCVFLIFLSQLVLTMYATYILFQMPTTHLILIDVFSETFQFVLK